MHIQVKLILTLFIVLSSFSLCAHESQIEIHELMERYDQLMSGEKINSNQVFSHKFLEDFESEELNHKRNKANFKLEIKEGLKDKNLLFVKRTFENKEDDSTTFIIVKEKNSWRIEGTTSDDH